MEDSKRRIIGSIIGLIVFILCIASLTFAYYRWRSPDKNITLGLHDGGIKYVYSESNNLLSSTTLAPVVTYNTLSNSLLYADYTATNVASNDSYEMTAILHINSISNSLKSNAFKWVLLEKSGNSYSTVVKEGNFSGAVVGDNTIDLDVFITPGAVHDYRFIMYIDGNVQNNPTGGSIDAELELCDTLVPIIPITLDNNNASSGYEGTGMVYLRYGVGVYKDSTATTTRMTTSNNPITTPEREGHVFLGYYDQPNPTPNTAGTCVGNPLISATGYITNNFTNTKYREAATIYTCWKLEQYTLVFNSNFINSNGTRTNASPTSIKATFQRSTLDPTSITLPSQKYTVTYNLNNTGATRGKSSEVISNTFHGWYLDSSGTTQILTNVAALTLKPSVSVGNTNYTDASSNWIYTNEDPNVNVYGKWSLNNVTLTTLTWTGYTCKWAEGSTTGTLYDAGTQREVSNNITYYADCRPNNYQNTTTNKYYVHLSEAFNEASSGDTIKVLNAAGDNVTETSTDGIPVVASGKTLTLDLNGKHTILDGTSLTNNGTLTIKSSSSGGKLSGNGLYVINNGTGTLTVNSGTVEGSKSVISSTTGPVTISGGTINSTATSGDYYGIYKNGATGTVTISSGSVTGERAGICNNGASQVTVSGGTVSGTYSISYGIFNKSTGTISVSGGTVTASEYGIYNTSTGAINITGGTVSGNVGIENYNTASGSITINGTNAKVIGNSAVLYSIDAGAGDVTVTKGEVKGVASGIAATTGTITVNGGTVSTTGTSITTYGIYKNGASGTVTVSSGSVTGYRAGIYNNDTSQVTVSGGTVSGLSGYGIYNYSTGTINITGGTTNGDIGIINGSTGTVTINGTNAQVTGSTGVGIDAGTGNVTVTKGTVNGKTHAIKSTTGEVTVNGGTVASTATSGNYDGIYKNGASGTVTVSSGSVTGYRAGIYNNDTSQISITGGTVTGTTQGIYNISTATVSITGGTVTGNIGAKNSSTGTIIVNGTSAQVTGSTGSGIEGGTGTVTVTKGTVTGKTHGISSTTGTVTVNGGTVTSSATSGTNAGIYKNGASGTVTVSSGSVSGLYGIYNNVAGPISITGGTVTGTSNNGIYNKTTGTITVTGGTVTGADHGIYLVGAGTLTMGENSGTPSTTSPEIKTTGTSNKYGVYVGNSSAIYNFYDGKVTSASGTGKSIYTPNATWPINVPNNYDIVKTTASGTETAVLGAANNYQNTSTSRKYMYLWRAMSEVATGQTIKALANTTETTAATLAASKTVTLDLGGKTVTLSGVNLTNNGTLTVSTSTSGGKLTGTADNVINNGTATLTVSSGTVEGTKTVISSTTGPVTISGGTITSTATSGNYDGIYKNGASGTVTVSSGSVTGYRAGIYNNDTSQISITGGTVTGTTQGIYNISTATVSITGGTVTGNIGAKNTSTGTIIVNGTSAQVTGSTGSGIEGGTGTVTVTKGTVSGKTHGISSTTGTVTVNGGTVTSSATSGTNAGIYKNGASGTVTVSSGTVSGLYGIYNNVAGPISISGGTVTGTSNNGIYNKTTGTITITGGTVSGTDHGIYLVGAGTLTMGTNDGGTPSTTSPEIKTTGTSNKYGVYVGNASATYNFYDGKVTSASGRGKSIYTPSVTYTINTPTNYGVARSTTSGTETAVLGRLYTITFVASTGINEITMNGWTGTGTQSSSLTKSLPQGHELVMSDLAVTYYTGFNGHNWAKTSGTSGTLSNGIFTVGSSTATLTATGIGVVYKANIYYNANSTHGSTTIRYTNGTSAPEAKCTVDRENSSHVGICDVTIPDAVKNSVGTYNNAYVGLNTTTGSMSTPVGASATTVTISADTTYYSVYRTPVNVYYPTSVNARGNTQTYRNQWFKSTSAMETTVISSTDTGTTNYSYTSGVSGYSFYGYATSAASNTIATECKVNSNDGNKCNAVSYIASGSSTTYYIILYKSVTGTFYFSNSTAGAVKTATANSNQYVRCTSSAAEISNTNFAVPTLSGETAPRGTARVTGWATGVSTLSNLKTNANDINTGTTSYYAVYRNTLTIYRPTSETVTSSTTAYRNAFINAANDSNYTVKVATSNTGTSDMTSVSGLWSSLSFSGYATSVNSITIATECTGNSSDGNKCNSVASIASGNSTTYYVIGTRNINTTIYYNSNSSTCGGLTASTASMAVTRTTYPSSTSATTYKDTWSVPSTVSGSKGKYNGTYSSIAKATGTTTAAVSGTTQLGTTTTLYAVYSEGVKNYRPTSTTAATTQQLYRNEWFTSNSAMTVVIATSATGTSNFTPTYVTNYGNLVGFSTAASTNTPTYATVAALATACDTEVYQIAYGTTSVTATFYYNSNSTCGSKTVASKTAGGTRTTYLRPTSKTAANTTITEGSISIPTEVSGSVGQSNNTYVGVQASSNTTAPGNMSNILTSVNTAYQYYFAVYSKSFTNIRPSSTSAATSQTLYRNQWFTNSTTLAEPVVATSATGTSNFTPTTVSGYGTLAGFATASGTNTYNYATVALLGSNSCDNKVYQIDKKEESVTATFYYNSNNTCGSQTIASKTASGTKTTFLRCTSDSAAGTNLVHGAITIPTEVTGSKGKPNNSYAGVQGTTSTTAPGNMSNVLTAATTANTYYYTVYSQAVNNYRPTSTSASTTQTLYRNQWFTNSTTMATSVIATTGINPSTTTTSTTNFTPTYVSGYGTLVGWATSASTNTATIATVEALAAACDNEVYQIAKKTETVTSTFYYNSNTACGSATVASKTSSGIKTTFLRCTSKTAAGTDISHGSVSIPTEVSGSVGLSNNTYAGVQGSANTTAPGNMSNILTSATTAYLYYFTAYSKSFTNYRPNSTTTATTQTLYRNQWFTNSTTMANPVVSTSATGTSNFSPSHVTGYPTLVGWSTSSGTNTATYSSVANLAKACDTKDYQIDKIDDTVTATFYYNSNNTCGSTTIANKTSSATKSTYLRCTSDSAAGTNVVHGNISIPTEVSSSKGSPNNAYIGLQVSSNTTAPGNMSNVVTTASTANAYYFAVYSTPITNHYSSSTSACASQTLYRNQWFTNSTTIADPVVATTVTGTTNFNPTMVSGYGTLVGFATATSTNTATFTTVANLAKGYTASGSYNCATDVDQISKTTASVTATFYYNSNSTCGSSTVANKTSSGTKTTFLRCTSASASGTDISHGSIPIPSEVSSSKGFANNAYSGVQASSSTTAPGNMNNVSTTATTGNTYYFAAYSEKVYNYRPTSTSASTTQELYRNQWFTNSTTLATPVIATSATGTANFTPTYVSGYGTLVGFATSASTNTAIFSTVANWASGLTTTSGTYNCATEVYQISKKVEEIRPVFNYSNDATGGKGMASGAGGNYSANRTTYLRPTSKTAAGTSVSEGTISSTPSSTAPYGTTFVGWATSNNTMSVVSSVTTAYSAYYAVYRSSANAIKLYYPTSTSAASNVSLYRKGVFGGNERYTMYLSQGDSTVQNEDVSTLVVSGYSTIVGLATAASTNTATYLSMGNYDSGAAYSTTTSLYLITKKTDSVSVTFYYNSNTTCGSKTISNTTASGTKTTFLRCTSNTGAGTSVVNGAIAIPSAVSTSKGEANNAYVGVQGSTSTTAPGNMNNVITSIDTGTSYSKFFAVYRTQVTNIRPSSESASTSDTLYRNQWFTNSTTLAEPVIATTATGTTNFTPTMVSGYSTLVGFAKAASTNNATFTTVANWAKGLTASSTYDCATTVYQIDKKTERVEPSFSLSDSATGSITWVSATRYYGTKTTYLRPTSASAAGTSVSHGAISSTPTTETAKLPYGAEFVGWSTSETSMSTVTPTTENTWYYAVYRSSVTHYYYNSGWTTRTIYRNIFDGNGTGANGSGYYKAVFSTTTTGTSNNVTDPGGPGGSTLAYITSYLGDPENDLPDGDELVDWTIGLSSQDNDLIYTPLTTLYSSYIMTVNSYKGSHVQSIGGGDTGCLMYKTTNSSAPVNCTVTLRPITPEAGYHSVGWSTTNGATTGTPAGSSYTVTTSPTNLYANAVANITTINVRKDGSAWSGHGMGIALYTGTTLAYGTTGSSNSNGSSVDLAAVPAGTYNVYIGKDKNHVDNLVDSGVDVTVTASSGGSATVNYYTLSFVGTDFDNYTLNGSNVRNDTSVVVAGGVSHSISATPNVGYVFWRWHSQSGTVTFGDLEVASTSIIVDSASTITGMANRSFTCPSSNGGTVEYYGKTWKRIAESNGRCRLIMSGITTTTGTFLEAETKINDELDNNSTYAAELAANLVSAESVPTYTDDYLSVTDVYWVGIDENSNGIIRDNNDHRTYGAGSGSTTVYTGACVDTDNSCITGADRKTVISPTSCPTPTTLSAGNRTVDVNSNTFYTQHDSCNTTTYNNRSLSYTVYKPTAWNSASSFTASRTLYGGNTNSTSVSQDKLQVYQCGGSYPGQHFYTLEAIKDTNTIRWHNIRSSTSTDRLISNDHEVYAAAFNGSTTTSNSNGVIRTYNHSVYDSSHLDFTCKTFNGKNIVKQLGSYPIHYRPIIWVQE